MAEILLFITTESDKDLAKNLAKKIIEGKYAACCTFNEISSIYRWKGDIELTTEVEILIKSTPERLHDLIKIVKQESSYEMPQIIYKNFNSEDNYHNWVKKIVS